MFKQSPYLMTWFLYVVAIALLFFVISMVGGENMMVTAMGMGVSLKPPVFISILSLIPMTALLLLKSKKRATVKPAGTMLWVGGGTVVTALIFLFAVALLFISDANLGTAFFAPAPPLSVGTKNNVSILGTSIFAFVLPVAMAGLIAKIASSSFERGDGS